MSKNMIYGEKLNQLETLNKTREKYMGDVISVFKHSKQNIA